MVDQEDSAALDKEIDTARFAPDDKVYKAALQNMVDIVMTDLPRIPLYQPYVNVAMQKNISGYEYWFHRRLDYRAFAKG